MRLKMLAITGMLLAAAGVHADNLLSIAPLRLILSDAHNNDLLTLTNRSEKTKTYKLVMKDQVMRPDGNIVAQDDFEYSAKRLLRFMPRVVTLEPGQRQNIRVMAAAPADLANGDYHTHLIFDEVKDDTVSATVPVKGFKTNMENLYSVGVPVVYQHGSVSAEMNLQSATLGTDRGRPVVNVVLGRKGNAEADGLVRVLDRATQAPVAQARNMHMYREVDTVTLQLPLKDVSSTSNLEVHLDNDGKELGVLPVK